MRQLRTALSVLILLASTVTLFAAPDAVNEAARASTALIKSVQRRGLVAKGSAAYIGNNRFITNHHVVEGGRSFYVSVPGSTVNHRCKLIAVDAVNDIAMVEALDDVKYLKPVTFAGFTPILSKVYASGYGSSLQDNIPGEFLRVYGGGIPDHTLKHKGWYRFGGDEGCSIPGDSGGPAFNSEGHYIGPIWGTDEVNTYAVKHKTVLKFIAMTYIGKK